MLPCIKAFLLYACGDTPVSIVLTKIMKIIFIITALLTLFIGVGSAQSKPGVEPSVKTIKLPATNEKPEKADIKPYQIISKPQPGYSERARSNGVEGIVHLKVELLANGTIGNVGPVTYLPNGLTERAISAARSISFTPQVVNGQPVTTEIDIYYTFSLHFDDADEDIKRKVEIISQPKPAIAANELPDSAGGKISVEVFFGADRRVKVFKPVTDISPEMAKRVETAVGQIKFRPALHRNGKKASVTKVIIYEVK